MLRLSLAALAAMVCLGVPSHALPPGVTAAYEAWRAASEAGDRQGAAAHADAAWQAGQAAGLPPSQSLPLAEARAQAFSDLRDVARAGAAWDTVISLLQETGAGREALDDALFSATGAYQLAGNRQRASERAASYLALAGAETPSERVYAAHYILATGALDTGRVRQAGTHARQGLAVLEQLGPSVSPSTLVMAKTAAIGSALERNQLDTAFYLSLATRVSRALDYADPEHNEVYAWLSYIQRNLRPPDRLGLTQRQTASSLFRFDVPSEQPGFMRGSAPDFDWSAPGHEDARPVRRDAPGFPAVASSRGMEGIALVRFDVDARGRTENVSVLLSIPSPLFGESAVRAVQRWRYEPARVDGRAVRREGAETVFEFMLQ